jgi:cyanate permease
MRASLRTHVLVQRKNLLKIALYSAEAFGLCFLGLWLFRNDIPLQWKLLMSGIFGGVIFLIGLLMVLFVSYSTLADVDEGAGAKEKRI